MISVKKFISWCKVNWKFLVGFIVPFVIMSIIGSKKSKNMLAKGKEIRKKELEVINNVNKNEKLEHKKLAEDLHNDISEVNDKAISDLSELQAKKEEQTKKIEELDQKDITKKLSSRFDLNNKD